VHTRESSRLDSTRFSPSNAHQGERWLFLLASLVGGGALGWLSHRFVKAPMLALKKGSVRKE